MTKLYMFHPTTNRPVPLDPAMVALRDKLAGELGYVKRPCTLTSRTGASPPPCWERDDSRVAHQVAARDLGRQMFLFWPRDVDLAALEIDGGRRKPRVAAAAPEADWRDVRHEEPAEEGAYLVCVPLPEGGPWVGITAWLGGAFPSFDGVTHWMPLPAPPEPYEGMLMNDTEFRDLVRRMRAAQKRWFDPRTKNDEALELSKSLERQVDRALADQGQGLLFGEGR